MAPLDDDGQDGSALTLGYFKRWIEENSRRLDEDGLWKEKHQQQHASEQRELPALIAANAVRAIIEENRKRREAWHSTVWGRTGIVVAVVLGALQVWSDLFGIAHPVFGQR